jgi:hypothetical protein
VLQRYSDTALGDNSGYFPPKIQARGWAAATNARKGRRFSDPLLPQYSLHDIFPGGRHKNINFRTKILSCQGLANVVGLP